MTPQQIVAAIFPAVEWVDGERGFMPCPGKHLHSLTGGKKDCQVKLNGAPTIFCFHNSCQAVIEDANYKMRFALWKESSEGMEPAPLTEMEREKIKIQMDKKRSEEKSRSWASEHKADILEKHSWPIADVFHESPVTSDEPSQDWTLFLTLFEPDDVLWTGQPMNSGPRHAHNFQTVRQWKEQQPAGRFTCPAVFKPGTLARKNENVLTRRYLVVESDVLTMDESAALFRWLRKRLTLRAIVHTGGKSLHGWFVMPDTAMLEKLRIILPEMGCDWHLFTPSQPVRVPGIKRGENWQCLYWFDNKS